MEVVRRTLRDWNILTTAEQLCALGQGLLDTKTKNLRGLETLVRRLMQGLIKKDPSIKVKNVDYWLAKSIMFYDIPERFKARAKRLTELNKRD